MEILSFLAIYECFRCESFPTELDLEPGILSGLSHIHNKWCLALLTSCLINSDSSTISISVEKNQSNLRFSVENLEISIGNPKLGNNFQTKEVRKKLISYLIFSIFSHSYRVGSNEQTVELAEL